MSKRIGANYRMKRIEKRQKHPQKQPRIIGRCIRGVASLCFAAVLGGLAFISARKVMCRLPAIEALKVNGVAVRGIMHVDTSDIMTLAGIQPGISLVDVKAADICRRIKKNPWIEGVKVSRNLSRKIRITITERKPVALVNIGSLYLVDRTGFLWPLSSHEYWDLPVISGLSDTLYPDRGHRLKKDHIRKMNALFAEVNGVDEAFAATISQIAFKKDNIVSLKLGTFPFTVSLEDTKLTNGLIHLKEIVRTIDQNAETLPRTINLSCANMAFVQY